MMIFFNADFRRGNPHIVIIPFDTMAYEAKVDPTGRSSV